MTEITTVGVVIILTTILLAIAATKVFSHGRSRDSGGGGVPIIPDTSSTIKATSSSSSSSGSWKYDVFLSFRGEDTRKTFVDHLYHALEQHGILTYKDDVTLDRGDTIGPSLLKAIQESQIALIIFSEKYADSSWCLDELSYIMKCNEERGQIVMPIFYNMDPSDVRKQKGKFGKAFAKHNNKNKVESWKKTLVGASNIAGWEPKHVANGHEAKCIQEIVDSILGKLSSLNPVVEDEELVGMGTRLQDLKSQLRIGSGGVRMVGIWGLGGGGKTTLATSIYKEISCLFDRCCFLDNIREESRQQNGLKNLQEKLLSAVFGKNMQVESVDMGKHTIKRILCRRNVLIVLDDVDDLQQLEILAGGHNSFGNGSRIIITTRDEQVLISHRVDEVYHVRLLSHDEAIRLFRRHAYHADKPVQDYEELSLRVISYVNGLPLALKILGSFLYGRDKDEWLSTLARLKDHPEMDILEKLKISYDGLKDVEKELFLDIACFYRGERKDVAMVHFNGCGFYPDIGVKVLIEKALITVSSNGYFDMHDLVQEMGHYIVRGEHPNNPEKHRRVWRKEDIEDICSRNATTENHKIEAIKCVRCSSNIIMLVSNIKKLRFLKVESSIESYYDEGPSFLSNELRYIHWENYPASPFPESFQPTKLAFLYIKYSLQRELWKGYKYLPCLKELHLVYAGDLVRTPDFGGLPCLQKLILYGCYSLEEIHPSLGNHASLVYLSLSYCEKLTRFPSIVRMEKLKTLKFLDCEALVELPNIEAKMDNLIELSFKRVGIEVKPSIVVVEDIAAKFFSPEMLIWELSNRSRIKLLIASQLPSFLIKLNLDECKLYNGPEEIGKLFNLQELSLTRNYFRRLDFSFSRLTRLKTLNVSHCRYLVELPELPSSLAILVADYCLSLEAIIRDDIHMNCNWLCKVSLVGGRENIVGGERLLETMLQGKGVESGCLSLHVEGVETAKGLLIVPSVVRGARCGMQLPENWYNDFSGFLICAVFVNPRGFFCLQISMKYKENGGLMGMEDDHDVCWEESVEKNEDTWVGYISFGSLRNTLWWDQTSHAVEIEFESGNTISGCGFKLIPKRSETTSITDSSSFDFSDDYTCHVETVHDSKSAFKFNINPKFNIKFNDM